MLQSVRMIYKSWYTQEVLLLLQQNCVKVYSGSSRNTRLYVLGNKGKHTHAHTLTNIHTTNNKAHTLSSKTKNSKTKHSKTKHLKKLEARSNFFFGALTVQGEEYQTHMYIGGQQDVVQQYHARCKNGVGRPGESCRRVKFPTCWQHNYTIVGFW